VIFGNEWLLWWCGDGGGSGSSKGHTAFDEVAATDVEVEADGFVFQDVF